ncbi:MAG: hypothetical protein WBF17_16715, partial [Phycisphaerae bacterium]
YDIARNLGWASVSVNHDTATFAVNTTTDTGLKVRRVLDTKRYRTEVKVSDEQMSQIRLEPARFHGDWNYSIKPSPSTRRYLRSKK